MIASIVLAIALGGATFDDAMIDRQGDIARAVASREAIRNDPANPLGYFGLALSLYQMGRNEESLAVYDKMIELNVDDATPQYVPSDRGIILMRLGRNEEARRDFENALAVLPSFGHAHFNLAVLLVRTGGDPQQVLDHLDLADADDPDKQAASHRAYRGAALFRLGRLEEARVELEESIRDMPENFAPFNYPSNDVEALFEGRYYLAQVLKALGRSTEGMQQLENIFTLRAKRLSMPIQVRSSNRPTGYWPCYEDPDRFVSLLHLWGLPTP